MLLFFRVSWSFLSTLTIMSVGHVSSDFYKRSMIYMSYLCFDYEEQNIILHFSATLNFLRASEIIKPNSELDSFKNFLAVRCENICPNIF